MSEVEESDIEVLRRQLAEVEQTDYVFYELDGGRVTQRGTVEALYVPLQRGLLPPGQEMLLARVEDATDRYVVNGQVVHRPPPFDLTVARLDAEARVRAQAEARRMRFISPGEGKAMAYQQKATEAEAYLRDASAGEEPSSVDYPHIFGEAEAIGVTPTQMAELILNLRRRWQRASAEIERVERLGILAAQSATSEEEANAASELDWSALENGE